MSTVSESVTISRELLERLAPDQPMNQDEQGGCVWCDWSPSVRSSKWNASRYAGPDPLDHDDSCPWVAARRLLEPAA